MDSSRQADAPRRLELLQALGLLNADPDPALARLARVALAVADAQSARVVFFAQDRPRVLGLAGAPMTREIEEGCSGDAAIVVDGVTLGAVQVFHGRPGPLSPECGQALREVAGMGEDLLLRRLRAVEQADALAESGAMLAQAQRLARLFSWELDVATGMITWPDGVGQVLGLDAGRMPACIKDFRPRVHADDWPVFDASVGEAFEHRRPTASEFRFLAGDGRTMWLSSVGEPVFDEAGTMRRFRGTMQDVTDRKKVERLAREGAERDRLLWQTTTDAVLIVDEDSVIRFCNPAVRDVFGYAPDELLGRELAVLQPERLRAAHREGFERYLTSNQRRLDWRAVEAIGRFRDGREFPVEISFSDMGVDRRRVFGAFVRDVSARKTHELALQRSEERYRRIVQTAEEGIWMIDAASDTTFVNPKMASMLGYLVEEMVGRNLYEFMDATAAGIARENVRRRELGISEQHDFRLRRKDGSDLWTAMSTSAAFDEHGNYAGALAMVTDITERRRAEEALRASEARFRSLTALSSDWYWEQDEEFRMTRVVGGRAREDQIGLRRSIGLRPWEAASPAMDPAAWTRHRARLEAHMPFRDFEISHLGPDGQVLIVSVSGEPMFDDDGRFIGYRGVGRNVTEQRRGQIVRQELEAQLRESQKMEAIGVLAGGIAHDFNNVLAGILGNVALALQDLVEGHPAATSLEQIRKASQRGRGLVQQILAFARRQPRAVVDCELRPLVEESVGLLRATLPAGVTLATQVTPEPLHVMADATQVEQVLMNLGTNAWHALEGNVGRIVVGLEAVELDPDEASLVSASLLPGRYALLWVGDDGRGMSAATRSRIFEPFFTTKPIGEGTGLGLAVAHGIVAAHGGAIVVESAEGRGSTFRIYLPRSRGDTPVAERAQPIAAVHRGQGERVLYIDDDDVMVVMVERLLEGLGYATTCQVDPAAAVALVRADPAAFDIVVTDLNMPGMSGLDVARELRRVRADLPVVISSGNIPDQLQAEALEVGVRALLHKEYTLEELGAVIHWVLAGGQRLALGQQVTPLLR